MSASRLEELRASWEHAIERDRHADAVKALVELEQLDPDEPRWSQRLGEALRRAGRQREAEDAFARAAERFMEKGFLPRAIAMAKLVASLDPARGDLLARLEPKVAPAAAVRPAAPLPVRPVPLHRAEGSSIDEVRFDDLDGPSSIDFLLEDVSDVVRVPPSDGGSSIVVLHDSDIIAEASLPPTSTSALASLPVPTEPSIDRLGTMASFRLFAGLSRDALLALSAHAEVVEFVAGAMVIVRDEPAFALYAIIDGVARVTVRGSPEIRLGEGEIFGEATLLGEGERQADVRAETPLMTLRVPKAALDDVTARHAEVGEALFQLLARRLVTNLMHASPLFSAFDAPQRLELAQMFEVRRAEPGTRLAERGKRSDGLYVLLAGHVTARGRDRQATRIARGTAFGHVSLLGAMASEETIEAASEAVLLRLPAARFAALAATYPPVLAVLAESADEPLRESLLPGG